MIAKKTLSSWRRERGSLFSSLIVVPSLTIAALFYCTGAEAAPRQRVKAKVAAPHINNFALVEPKLYRSAQPADANDFAALQQHYNIKTIINLRADMTDRQISPAAPQTLIQTPLNEFNIASGEGEIIKALRAIRAGRARGGVLVHCQYGSDRTGAVIALWRMVGQGWSKEAALEEMTSPNYGFHTPFLFFPPGNSIRDYVGAVDVAELKRKISAPR